MKYKIISVMGTNCYLFWDKMTKKAVCIDPGFSGRKIAREIQILGLTLNSIFITHSHADHVSGIDDMCSELEEIPVIYMSKAELKYEGFPFKKPQSLFLWDLGFRTTSARLKSKSLRKK